MDIVELAEQGDLSAVIHLLEKNADPNTTNEDGWSPLIMASKGGHVGLVKELLSQKVSPNPSKIAHTALRAAAIHGHNDVLRYILLPSQALTGFNCTLQVASLTLIIHCRMLISAKADPNLTSLHGRTPLMGAARGGHVQSARILIAAGADCSAQNDDAETAADLAEGNLELADIIRSEALKAASPN